MPTQDEIDGDDFLGDFEDNTGKTLVKSLNLNPLPAVGQIAALPLNTGCSITTVEPALAKGAPPTTTTTNVECDDERFLQSGQPFEGRDVIYVHGLALGHLKNWMGNYSPAHQLWPGGSSEYLNAGGYFRTYAEEYWDLHIRENLFDPLDHASPSAGWQWKPGDTAPVYSSKNNRYMIVAWSSNQTLEYGQHAFLTQVQLAIASNTNVVTPPTSPMHPNYAGPVRMTRPFCSNGCVVISHSTGGLVVPSALSLASTGFFGQGGQQIVNRIRLHVALEGAISGSRLATVAVAAGTAFVAATLVPNLICQVLDDWWDVTGSCGLNTGFVVNSILRDLMPLVAQGVWGQWVDTSPVPTVTVAGGHPHGNYAMGITKPLLPGLDDGVVSMNSSCGNPNPVLPGFIAPSGVVVTSLIKSFDMGVVFTRGAKYWFSHRNLKAPAPGGNYLGGACIPYVTATGMILPVFSTLPGSDFDVRKRYGNHYSMLQSAADHSYDPGDSANPWSSSPTWAPNYPWFNPGSQGPAWTGRHYLTFLGASNREESSAVTNAQIYQQYGDGTYLVHPSFGNLTHEIVRGRRIRFKLFNVQKTVWIWKRTYHLLEKWLDKQNSHYVYEFVGRR